jgi:hypothetical protein
MSFELGCYKVRNGHRVAGVKSHNAIKTGIDALDHPYDLTQDDGIVLVFKAEERHGGSTYHEDYRGGAKLWFVTPDGALHCGIFFERELKLLERVRG